MPDTIIHITEDELYRLEVAYTSIHDATIRTELLRTLEAWVQDQEA
ncbi:MAG: hypothetical protein N4A53_13695 [Pelagimonas sp.]|jgi:hypothetical protein|nr:hypothetical protein [Pelagimonas sp.]